MEIGKGLGSKECEEMRKEGSAMQMDGDTWLQVDLEGEVFSSVTWCKDDGCYDYLIDKESY